MGALIGYVVAGAIIVVIIAVTSFSGVFEDDVKDELRTTPEVEQTSKPTPTPTPESEPEVEKEYTKYTCTGTALCINDKVTRIVDGDTIHVGSYTIRLALVDTPEQNELGYSEASKFTSSVCPLGSIAIVDQDDLQPRDKYDRIVGKVICSGKNLNEELLQNNHAIFRDEFCKTSEFAREKWNPC